MEDFIFTTKEPLATNEDIMDWFSNEHFYEVFDEDAIFIEDDGTYAEVLDGKGQKWGLHASGDGDFVSHRIRFELLAQSYTYKSKVMTVQVGNTTYPVENGMVMFGLGKPSNK